jgi:phosphoglycolate phosphatase
MRPMSISVAVLDMAGTTVADEGAVEEAFVGAMTAVGIGEESSRLPAMLAYVRATMGQSKIEVFRELLDHDDAAAREANLAFEHFYATSVKAGRCRPIPGAAAAFAELRAAGIKVALTTGFSSDTQRTILDELDWSHSVDLALTPSDVVRGRPYPDLVLTAMLRLGAEDVRDVAVVGDTASDMLSGVRAGASVVVGVLTGIHEEPALRAAGATHVLASIAELPALLLPNRKRTSSAVNRDVALASSSTDPRQRI